MYLIDFFITDGHSAFSDVVYLVNHEVSPDVSNILEGSTVAVIFRLFNRYPVIYTANHCYRNEPHISCHYWQQCAGPDSFYAAAIMMIFHPIKLSDNGSILFFNIAHHRSPTPIIITGKCH